jgi:hypothetical protein
MDKELMEAKAAVEECYRRRARRAGLEGTLPMGRPMTEREIDDLGELLGDRVGSRAKRGREIEEMMIEDMEAEIRETNAIRNHQEAEEGRHMAATDATGIVYVPDGEHGGRVHRLRLLQPEQRRGGLLSPGARRLHQHGQRGGS